jgi:hypothetical protein
MRRGFISMIAPIAILALVFAAPQSATENPCANSYTQNVWDPRFTPGQHWSYRARPLDKDSTLTIIKIDYVPDIGIVVHIMVDHVDFEDKPGDRPRNNGRTEYFAIRRDSLDASVLDVLNVSEIVEPPNIYNRWQANCAGLTYSSTVADTLQTLQDVYQARQAQQLTSTTRIFLTPIPSGKPEELSLTLSQHINGLFIKDVQGQLSFKSGSPVKNAKIEVTGYDSNQSSFTRSAKTSSEGTFPIPSLPQGAYSFRLTLDGFQSITGTLSVSVKQASLFNPHSEP